MGKESFSNLMFGLFLVVIIFFSAIIFSLSLRPFSLEGLLSKTNYYYNLFYSNLFNQIVLGLIAVLLIILAIYLIWKKGQYNKEDLSVAQKTSFGEIKISTNSIKHLTLKVIKGMGDIKEAKPEINILKMGGINIDLHLSVMQDVNIPELSEKIQRKVKEYLSETSGIETKEIKIHIDKIVYEDNKIK